MRDVLRELGGRPSARRARRALERQLAYQQRKAAAVLAGSRADDVVASCERRTSALRARLARIRPIGEATRVLEVGSGAHGHVFFLSPSGSCEAVGVDPLAEAYRELFPWQHRARTLAAYGESLPFPDASFDVVLSDNVVDHAEDPRRIVDELVRVLAPGGLLYFTVNVHHPIYDLSSRILGAARALGVPIEIGPFEDHTVHLARRAAERLVRRPELRWIEDRVVPAPRGEARHLGDHLKRLFFKNATFEVIATRA